VIARPYVGTPTPLALTVDETSRPSQQEYRLNKLFRAGIPTIRIGKIDDLFAGRGLKHKIHTEDNADGMAKTLAALSPPSGFFTNLVEFDMVWGHRNDPVDSPGVSRI
jgi:phosphopentomutase